MRSSRERQLALTTRSNIHVEICERFEQTKHHNVDAARLSKEKI